MQEYIWFLYLYWMIVQPKCSSQRVDDLMIKIAHLFRCGIWRSLGAYFSDDSPLFSPPPWETPHSIHIGNFAAQNRSFRKSAICFFYVLYNTRVWQTHGLDFSPLCNKTILFITRSMQNKYHFRAFFFLQIMNEFSYYISAELTNMNYSAIYSCLLTFIVLLQPSLTISASLSSSSWSTGTLGFI